MPASASPDHEGDIGELARLADEQAARRRVATLVAHGASSENLFALVAEQVAQVLHVPLVSVVRFEADDTATECANRSDEGELFPVGTRWSLEGTSVLAEVRQSGRPARIIDYTGLEGEIAETVRDAGIRSTVGVPIVVAGERWGAILVSSRQTEPLPGDTESRLLDFSELVAVAISNVQARADLQRLAEEQAALRRVATMVARDSSPEEVFTKVAEEVAQLLGVEVTLIQRYEPDGFATTVGDCGRSTFASLLTGDLTGAFAAGTRSKLEGNSVTMLVYRTGRPVRFDGYDRAKGPIARDARRLGVRSAVGSPIVVGGRLWGAIVAATTRAEPMPALAESRIGKFTELVATAIANVQARADLQRLAQEQAALRHVATMVARESSPVAIFAKVAEEVAQLLGVDAAGIQRYGPNGDATVVGSWGNALVLGSHWTVDEQSVTGLVYRTERPVRVDDLHHTSGLIAAGARERGLRSAIGSPIVVNGRLWGAIVAATTRAEPMPADAEARIAEFTALVATAISNVQARSDLAASRARVVAAADEERRRVVRDLHDGAQQRLVNTIVTLKLARRALQRNHEIAAGLVSEALGHAQTATDELRELAHGILPSALTHGGLRAGIGALASRMLIPVDTDISVDRLPGSVEATAYFVVAEALTNVAKHSHAHRATVSARLESDTLHVEVRDDGVGGARDDGPGIIGLCDRLAVLDGSLWVESPAAGGTLIAASIPVRP